MRNMKLLQLFNANRGKGSFKAEGNTIYIYDVIVGSDLEAEWFGGVSPQAFAKELAGMTGEVHLRIDSPGGDVFAARAMQQAIREHQGDVIVHVDGVAASAASLIAVTGTKTLMAAGSMLMIHKAWTFAMGNGEELRKTADLLDQIDMTIAESYAAVAKGEASHFLDLMAAETWFTAQGAVDAGLADEAVEDGRKTKAHWNLATYDHAPELNEDEAPPAPAVVPTVMEDDANQAKTEIEQRQRRHLARMLQTAA